MEIPEQKMQGKMEMIAISGDLMPGGKPDYLAVIRYPMIRDLVKTEGKNVMLKLLLLLVRDFCNCLNVVRNMNDDQMIESASMLLDECDNFRLEDYVMMFAMAKRGELVKIFDRLDISVITQIMDEYWLRRKRAGDQVQEAEIKFLDSLGSTTKEVELMNSQDAKMIEAVNGLTEAFEAVRLGLTDNGYKPVEKEAETVKE